MLSRRRFASLLASLPSLLPACSLECDRSQLPFELDPDGLLDLAAGLSYVVIGREGDVMSDGFRMPSRPDGMGCVQRDGRLILMRNHELHAGPAQITASDEPIPEAFVPMETGGVTRLVVDPDTLELLESNLVLTGTQDNCSGGMTELGWLSCEESREPGHGFVFLCDVDAAEVAPPVQLAFLGQFNHEAAAMDPRTGAIYLTEDETDSCFYRWLPTDPTAPLAEGRLQVLVVLDEPRARTTRYEQGSSRSIDWIDVPDAAVVRRASQDMGAAVFVRGEGAHYHDGSVFFSCTEGGPIDAGQVFRVHIDDALLEAVLVSTDAEAFNSPDNLTLSPDGTLWVTEDAECQCLLHAFTPDGVAFVLARGVEVENELAGVCVSPDGRTVFLNLQKSGVTVAIRGVPELLRA